MATSCTCNCNRFLNTSDTSKDRYDSDNYSSSSAIIFNTSVFVLSYYWCHCISFLSQLSHTLTRNRFIVWIRHWVFSWFAFGASRVCNYRQLVAMGGEFRGGCPSLTRSLCLDRKVHPSIWSHWFQRFSIEERAKKNGSARNWEINAKQNRCRGERANKSTKNYFWKKSTQKFKSLCLHHVVEVHPDGSAMLCQAENPVTF